MTIYIVRFRDFGNQHWITAEGILPTTQAEVREAVSESYVKGIWSQVLVQFIGGDGKLIDVTAQELRAVAAWYERKGYGAADMPFPLIDYASTELQEEYAAMAGRYNGGATGGGTGC